MEGKIEVKIGSITVLAMTIWQMVLLHMYLGKIAPVDPAKIQVFIDGREVDRPASMFDEEGLK